MMGNMVQRDDDIKEDTVPINKDNYSFKNLTYL